MTARPLGLAAIQRQLEQAGHEYARVHAALLLERLPRSRLPAALHRAREQVPVPLIVGSSPLLGLRLQMDRSVLVPGPETAALARAALELLGSLDARPRVLEIGTGSGAIAIFLACHRPDAEIVATDLSRPALALAKRNAAGCDVDGIVRLVQHDCRRPLLRPASIDLVVSNPPYVPRREIHELPLQWRRHTPRLAIDGGEDGLDLARCVIDEARRCLRAGGWLALECNIGQASQVTRLMDERGVWREPRWLCQREGGSRVLVVRR